MTITGARSASMRATMDELADSGRCIDFWDVETGLRARGYSADGARHATLDAAARHALNARCASARVRTLGSLKNHPARLDSCALYRKRP
ncbi:MAG: hypothetical protein IPK81_10490 [Rhodospirillales bacterium]|nr:MAG: hypothetical protein IPK81_10490 [Rhodospirillales bacterium]